mgnify:CR=1 FL=1
MDGWKYWEGKKVFIILKNYRHYSGIVDSVDITKINVWINLIDKFGKKVIFNAVEIDVMQEEDLE